jgi:hypothetical protein
MSWATCYSGSNNIHFDEPANMSDSRMFTQYNSNCQSNEKLKNNLGLTSNYDYRQYLINNGQKIIQKNQSTHLGKIGYVKPQVLSEVLIPKNKKYLYKNNTDENQPYGYNSSDLKNMYLSRHELQAKKFGPILTQEELLRLRSK